MSVYEVARNVFGVVKSFRRMRHIHQEFRFTRTRNKVVKQHTTMIREAARTSPCLLSLGRDGAHMTKAFLGHYNSLGFKSFVFLDNNSQDGGVSHLIDEAAALGCDISIYRCKLSYKRYKYAMKNFLIAAVPVGAWAFYADNDEFLVLPDGLNDVGQIITYLEEKGYDTLQFHLLDMFSGKPLHALPDETAWSSSDLERHYRYFDISALKSNRTNRGAYLQHHGGVRFKHFGVMPSITKATFFKKTGETNLRSSHHFLQTWTSRPRKLADSTLFVKHYKFNSRYAIGLEQAVRENSYYDNSRECRAAFECLTKDAFYALETEAAVVYQNCEQLRACDFITFSEDFQTYLQRIK